MPQSRILYILYLFILKYKVYIGQCFWMLIVLYAGYVYFVNADALINTVLHIGTCVFASEH
jgi:hypothetical protein